MTTKKILVCTDFSENSLPPFRLAVEYAKSLGASLTIMHVIDFWAGFPAYENRVPLDVQDVVAKIELSVNGELETMAEKCSAELDNVQICSRIGAPVDEIVGFAEDEGMDLIVMGTHGWTGFKHLVLGSVAEKVVRAAKCPVLIVRSAPAGEKSE